ncbi:hypothetical protein [Arenibacter arenosicollis]|nr:hypothetical protein [Arenibacter arenosicollis]
MRTNKELNLKKTDIADGITIKYHAKGETICSKGKLLNDQPDEYWE